MLHELVSPVDLSEPCKQVRVVIVDSHGPFREGLKILLENKGIEVVGLAQDGAQAVEVVRRREPQVVIMDAGMPAMNDCALASVIRKDLGIPTILLNDVLKNKTVTHLVQAIHEANRENVFMR